MRDISGEALDCFDAGVKCIGHIAQRTRQFSDLVPSASEIGNLDAGANSATDAFGAIGEAPYRTGDSAGEKHGEHDHNAGRYQEYFDNGETLGLHHVVDVGALR